MSELQRSISEVAESIKTRDLSPVELVQSTLEAIDRLNPTLNAYRLVLGERAYDQARKAEADIGAGQYRGPLHGVPIAVKDLMDLEGTTTPAGSIVLADRVSETTSEAVELLERAGAVIVGKTHMPEFAYSPASNNVHYGEVRNPWNQEYDTGGSSSGSGAAVAAGLAFGATGSDTGGSIRMPSAFCGLAGLKPTYGRVSARGAQTLSWSLDHIGPMTRAVRDAAIMLDAMAGYDPGDTRTRQVRSGGYVAAVEQGVTGLRIARVVNDGWDDDVTTPAAAKGVDDAMNALRSAGAVVSDLELPELRDLNTANLTILNIEAAAHYEPYLRDRYQDVSEWARDRLLMAYGYSPVDFVHAQQARATLRRRVEEIFEQYDVLALPGFPEAPRLGQVHQSGRLCGPFNSLGWPAMVVPSGLGEQGLPVSVQFAARPWRERTVLRAASVVERDGPWQGRLSPVLEAL